MVSVWRLVWRDVSMIEQRVIPKHPYKEPFDRVFLEEYQFDLDSEEIRIATQMGMGIGTDEYYLVEGMGVPVCGDADLMMDYIDRLYETNLLPKPTPQ